MERDREAWRVQRVDEEWTRLPKRRTKVTTEVYVPPYGILLLLSLFSMTRLGNTKNVALSRCRLLVSMKNGVKFSY